MKNFIQKIKDIWKHEELRKKIGVTLGFLLIYRVGCFIVLPGVDSAAVQANFAKLSAGGGGTNITDLLALFTGGAFTSASIFALGIMPYISASIIMQLMGIAVPQIQKMQKEGESGRKKINQWTRMLTIAICLVQAPGYIATSIPEGAREGGAFWMISAVTILTCCTLFVMWLGEKITDKGIGNGISMIIMIGIIATFPQSIFQEAIHPSSSMFFLLVELAAFIVVIGASVALVQAVRRVPLQRAKMNLGNQGMPMGEESRQFIPLRVNAAGVMPIIFAQAIMFVPLYLSNTETFRDTAFIGEMANFYGFWYNAVFFVMIVVFTYFYTAVTVNPNQIADDLKRQGSFIPGIKPGRPTAEFMDNILSKITLPGSMFLAFIAILPAIVFSVGLTKATGFSYFFGGTSLLIMVGVVLDTLQQIDSHLLSRHYDGLMKSGKMRGRSSSSLTGIAG
jgi:preprotein translocase subunit SecY